MNQVEAIADRLADETWHSSPLGMDYAYMPR